MQADIKRRLSQLRREQQKPGHAKGPDPFHILKSGAAVADLARHIHCDLPETLEFARLWGHGRFDGQQVHRTEPLQDGDTVEIHK